MEKIVRDYFSYITETETTTFTDCVKCLIAFTNSRFNNDVSLNAIAFIRYCSVKLAEGGFVCYDKSTEGHLGNGDASDENLSEKDDQTFFWLPLLDGTLFVILFHAFFIGTIRMYFFSKLRETCSGLSMLTSDTRPTIRKGALEVLFDILKDHGHLFSPSFWINVIKSVIYPMFNNTQEITVHEVLLHDSQYLQDNSWKSETDTLAAKCLIDLFVRYFDVIRSQHGNVVAIVTSYLISPYKQYANTGMAALLHLGGHLGSKLSEEEWKDTLITLKKSTASTLPIFSSITKIMQDIEIPNRNSDMEKYSDYEAIEDDEEKAKMETTPYAIVRMKNYISVLLQIVQVKFFLFLQQYAC